MDPTAHDHLLEIIRSVRRRWRLKLALRGVAATAACAAAALIACGVGLQWMRFTPESILAVPDRDRGAVRRARLRCCWSGR